MYIYTYTFIYFVQLLLVTTTTHTLKMNYIFQVLEYSGVEISFFINVRFLCLYFLASDLHFVINMI